MLVADGGYPLRRPSAHSMNMSELAGAEGTCEQACKMQARPRPTALDAGRTILGWETSPSMRGRRFDKVVLMGPHWSGTNAVRDEVLWRFHTHLLNPDKLEVCAHTKEGIRCLRDILAKGPVVRKKMQMGQKQVPCGYKLLPGPNSHALLGPVARKRRQPHQPQQLPQHQSV